MLHAIVPFVLLMAAGSEPALDEVRPGMCVRVQLSEEPTAGPPARGGARSDTVTGEVVSMDELTLTIRTEPRGEQVVVPIRRVKGIQRSYQVRSGQLLLKRAGVGFAIGAVVGGAIGMASGGCDPYEWCLFSRTDTTVLGAGSLGLLGAALGAASSLAGEQHWRPMHLGSANVSVVPRLDRQGLGASAVVRFAGHPARVVP